MRIDVISIFPDYLDPLRLSVIGRARQRGLLDLVVHDLRDYTNDTRRTVDDTPYGGGPGMVMTPEPWGQALDFVRSGGPVDVVPHLIIPTPSGLPFTQKVARQWAEQPWLVFACGRYEGIDERVLEAAADNGPMTPVSLGDYVVCGGEVAVLTIVEAVTRLVPGVLGNAESLVEESHEGAGLLEYPVYTKPPVWRGRQVPEVLLSGHHGEVERWRAKQRMLRTARRRPDLLDQP
ncbi:MAG: tRNA (guanosine(37)-N1)-methyltransferase TrmD [Actinomycetota bacterium]